MRIVLLVSTLVFALSSCIQKAPVPIKIGDQHQGGIVAYLLQKGERGYEKNIQHGLIVAPFDQSTYAAWGCQSKSIPDAQNKKYGAGDFNTLAVSIFCPDTATAARICYNLELNGYDDWVLPSYEELTLLYNNQGKIGGFEATGHYWSSTECNKNDAYTQWFFSGQGMSEGAKVAKNHVRAVRYF